MLLSMIVDKTEREGEVQKVRNERRRDTHRERERERCLKNENEVTRFDPTLATRPLRERKRSGICFLSVSVLQRLGRLSRICTDCGHFDGRMSEMERVQSLSLLNSMLPRVPPVFV